MIRFSAALVAAGLGLLLAGALTSELPLVYAAIAVSLVAAILLAAGVIAGRDEILGPDRRTGADQPPAEAHLGAAEAVDGGVAAAGSLPRTGTGPASPFSRPGTPEESPAAPAKVPGARLGDALGSRHGSPAPAAGAGAGSGSGRSGLGWPAGESPADALWARVDRELAAAGAAADVPKLTKDSGTEEVWERVELELTSPARWSLPAPSGDRGTPRDGRDAPRDLLGPSRDVNGNGAARAHTSPGAGAEPGFPDEPGFGAEREAGRERAFEAEPAFSADPGFRAEPEPDAEPGAQAEPEISTDPEFRVEPEAEPTAAGEPEAGTKPETGDGPETGAEREPGGEPEAGAEPESGDEPESAAEPEPGDEPATGDEPDTDPRLEPLDARDAEAGLASAGEPDAADLEPADPPEDGAGQGGSTTAPAESHTAAPAGHDGPAGTGQGTGTSEPEGTRGPAGGLPRRRSPAGPAMGGTTGADRVLLVSGVPRYHRAGCILIRFLGGDDVEELTRAEAEARGCVPCRACKPDQHQ